MKSVFESVNEGLRWAKDALESLQSRGGGSVSSPLTDHSASGVARGHKFGRPRVESGDLLAGRFLVGPLLGEGGMGTVFAAEDTMVGSMVAVKVIRAELVGGTEARSRLLQELRMARLVTHPNICRLYDVGECQTKGAESDTLLFLTMEMLHGETLAERLSRRPKLTLGEAKSITLQLCDAIDALHAAGVVHRDFKPGNVMVMEKDGALRAVVMDFGLSQPADPETTGVALPMEEAAGTPAYMAPEQAGGGTASRASDIYALGLVIGQMVTGLDIHTLVDRSTGTVRLGVAAKALLKDAGSVWLQTVARCIETNPSRRFPSVAAVRSLIANPPALQAAGKVVAGLGAALVLGGVAWIVRGYLPEPLPSERHIAILPFRQVTGTPLEAGVLEGASEALAQELSRCCTSGTAWFAPSSDIRQLGAHPESKARRTLGVNLILTGILQEKGRDISLELVLRDAATQKPLRSKTLKMTAAELPAAEHNIAKLAMEMLRLTPGKSRLANVTAVAPGALQFRLQALSYLNKRDIQSYGAAIGLLKRAIAADPGYGVAYADLARTQLLSYQLNHERPLLSEAADSIQSADRLGGDSPSLTLAKAQLLFLRGDPQAAVKLLQPALQNGTADPDTLVSLARYYDSLGNVLQAEHTYQLAIESYPGNWVTYVNLGDFYLAHGQYSKAEANFRIACDLAPDSARAISDLGAALLYQQKPEAVAVLQREIQLKPSAGRYTNLGTALYFSGRYRESVAAYTQATQLAPADHRHQRNLGDAYLRLHEEQNALKAYQKALALVEAQLQANPRDAAAAGYRALYLAKSNRKAEALRQAAVAQSKYGENSEILFLCAVAEELAGDRDNALATLKKGFTAGLPAEKVKTSAELEELRKDSRFAPLLPPEAVGNE